MRKLTIGETATFATTILSKEKRIICDRTVSPEMKSLDRYAVRLTFDMEGVTHDEILKLAAKQLVVEVQNSGLRTDVKALKPGQDLTEIGNKYEAPFNVRAWLDRERKKADPETRARTIAGKLSAAELEQLLKAARAREKTGTK